MAYEVQQRITTEEQKPIRLAPKTRQGNPASVQAGSVRVSSNSSTGAVAVVDAADELRVVLQSGSGPEDVMFLVEADADLGDGVTLVQLEVLLHVDAANAASMDVSEEPAEPKVVV